jgi:hypothetical protein
MAKNKSLAIPKDLEVGGKELAEVLGYNPVDDIFGTGSKVIAVRNFMALPDAIKYIKALKGTSLGFKTDEGPRQPDYSDSQLATVVTEALSHQFKLVNNEFNIIKGNMYGTQNGYRNLIKRFQGLEAEEPIGGAPKFDGDFVTIPMTCKYKIGNEENIYERDVVLTKKGYETYDGWVGKAQRKVFKDIYENASGKKIPDYDYEEGNPNAVEPVVGVNIKGTTPDNIEDGELVDAVVDTPPKDEPGYKGKTNFKNNDDGSITNEERIERAKKVKEARLKAEEKKEKAEAKKQKAADALADANAAEKLAAQQAEETIPPTDPLGDEEIPEQEEIPLQEEIPYVPVNEEGFIEPEIGEL